MIKSFILVAICFLPFVSKAQNYSETGSPAITNYSPKEHGENPQNWAISQDKEGIMYFGNGSGLLEFDGSTWRFHQLPNKGIVRCLANGDSGKIYAGAQGDLGYFLPEATTGKLTFYSLMKYVPENKKGFSYVVDLCVNNGKVYFNINTCILVWNIQKQTFQVIESKNEFHLMWLVNGTIYVREFGKGIEVLKDGSPVLLKGGEIFADERVYVMLPFPGEKGTSLIATRTMGLFKYDGNNFIPFKTEADEFIKENLLYLPGVILSDENILLNTGNGGVVIIDPKGREVRRYGLESGIINKAVNFAFQDKAGAIWLATDIGISRINYASPVSYFDTRNDFSTSALDVIRHDGIIYAATNNGVYSLDPAISKFIQLHNSNNQSFSFAEIGNELLVGTMDGLFRVEKDRLVTIRGTVGNEYFVYALRSSKIHPGRLFAGTSGGVVAMQKKNNTWTEERKLMETPDQFTSIMENKNGRLWMGTYAAGLYSITLQKDDNKNFVSDKPVVEHFDKINGLQDGRITAIEINGTDYFLTTDSLYRFDETNKRFISDPSDKMINAFYTITAGRAADICQQDSLGRVWIGTRAKLAMGTPNQKGMYKWEFARFNGVADEIISTAYTEKNGVTWLGTSFGMIKYDPLKKEISNPGYPALVRSVEIGKDSTIYFGGLPNKAFFPVLDFKNNSIRFRYSGTSYDSKNTNRFRTFLKGFDKDWTPWSSEATKEYTNLPPGKYTFNVMAKNILGSESSTGTFAFEILPPWYRTWWAYGMYATLFMLAAFLVARLQRRRVIAKERQLAEFRETKLRAEAENEKRKNIELISEIGKDITSSLSIEHIINTVYLHVNKLMDASVFGIGIYNKDKQNLEFPATREKEATLPNYSYDLQDKNRLAVWCFNNSREIFTNDFEKDHQKYIDIIPSAVAGSNTVSVVYLPLITKDKNIGVVTAQSFAKNAYTDFHLDILRNIATYTALALDNADAYRDLKATQQQLIQSEKMASLGELTAGIAHEIQNPLNFVNNFSELNKELIKEVKTQRPELTIEELDDLLDDIATNEEKINHHGKRADAIVKGMLQHSRKSKGQKELTDINALADEYLRLAYHGLRSKVTSFTPTIQTNYDQSIGNINIIPQDIGRVILNLMNNAFYAVTEKKKRQQPDGYEPMVSVSTKKLNDKIVIRVEDNGNGIPQDIVHKIFQPFFTTKPTGEGTGLGLSLSYDIVKAHGGEIKMETKEGESSEFLIEIPIYS